MLSPSKKNISGVARAPSLCGVDCLIPAHADESPTFATGLVTNLKVPEMQASNRNVQSYGFASFGLFLGTVTREGSAMECSFHTKE